MHEDASDREARREWEELNESIERRQRFTDRLRGSEMHWFFMQGTQAIEQELYLPGVASLIMGVEASVRVTMKQREGANLSENTDLGATLSNQLLRRAGEAGLPVETLAFPGEDDFAKKLPNKKNHVEIVRMRHNLAHGNFLHFVNGELGPGNAFFTPELLGELSGILLDLCGSWTEGLGRYRSTELGL